MTENNTNNDSANGTGNGTRRTLNPIAVALLIFGIALIGYEVYRDRAQRDSDAKQAARAEQMTEQAAELKRESERLREQAANLSEQTDRMRKQVQDERRAAAEERQRFITGASLAEGMQAASMAKVAIAEFYLSEGHFPSTNAEVGLKAPEHFTGRSLRRMKVAENGNIILSYDDSDYNNRADAKGTIRLVPESSPSGNIKWRCVTSTYANIATVLPSCEYIP